MSAEPIRCWPTTDPLYLAYHDEEWGRPVRDERGVYERLCLEGFQSGLSWITILRKREAFRSAFAGFDPEAVARFGEGDVERLLRFGFEYVYLLLHALFEQARRSRPCVLFFDEVDALAASRSDMRASAGRHMINQFLSEMDGIGASNEGVLILAATNAPPARHRKIPGFILKRDFAFGPRGRRWPFPARPAGGRARRPARRSSCRRR